MHQRVTSLGSVGVLVTSDITVVVRLDYKHVPVVIAVSSANITDDESETFAVAVMVVVLYVLLY